jgi:hypothetical protein
MIRVASVASGASDLLGKILGCSYSEDVETSTYICSGCDHNCGQLGPCFPIDLFDRLIRKASRNPGHKSENIALPFYISFCRFLSRIVQVSQTYTGSAMLCLSVTRCIVPTRHICQHQTGLQDRSVQIYPKIENMSKSLIPSEGSSPTLLA